MKKFVLVSTNTLLTIRYKGLGQQVRGGSRGVLSHLWALILACLAPLAFAHEHGANAMHPSPSATPGSSLVCAKSYPVHCAAAPSTVFDNSGKLWVAYALDGFVYVSTSADLGVSYSSPVRVNRVSEPVAAKGENRPKIALGLRNEIYISWTKTTEGAYTGDIRFARSTNGGVSFEPARTINDDGLLTSHRFDAMTVGARGNIYLAWIDKRDNIAAGDAPYPGAALYYTVSTDSGLHFSPNIKVADNSCECCRVAAAPFSADAKDESDSIALLWRHIFSGDIRDHALTRLHGATPAVPIKRVSFDNWQINACPHHGPSLSVDRAFLHATWFSGEATNPGIFYGRFSAPNYQPEQVVRISQRGSHAFVLSVDGVPENQLLAKQKHISQTATVHLVWKAFADNRTHIYHQVSTDAGHTWSVSTSVAATDGGSDHPFIAARQAPSTGTQQTFLSWQTENEGLRFFPLGIAAAKVHN
ncbi:MAG: hypothetical protein ACI9Y1_003052 [Lentisphaeria bacterium]